MDSLIKEIKAMISQKKSYLLESPDSKKVLGEAGTVVGRRNPRSQQPSLADMFDDEENQQDSPRSPKPEKDYKPGFNLYHGSLTEAFTQAQTMNGEMAEIIKKVTQWALMQVGQDQETNDVFSSSVAGGQIKPQEMATIVQKAVLIALNHVAQQAIKDITERDSFKKADE